jgi:hypothetical protein
VAVSCTTAGVAGAFDCNGSPMSETHDSRHSPLQPDATFSFALTEGRRLLSVDAGVTGLLGYPPEAFLEGVVTLPGIIHPDDADLAEILFSPGRRFAISG